VTSPAQPRDIVHAVLFSANGTTRLDWLPNATDIDVTSKFNVDGTCSFQVPLNDATTARIHERRIVRFTWYHDGVAVQREACRIESEGIELVVDGKRWLRFENQPTLLGMAGDAEVLPEYGVTAQAPSERLFGPMSLGGAWLVDGNWVRPVGFPFSEMTGVRKNHPPQLKGSAAWWIASYSPKTFVAGSTANYYRTQITPTETKRALLVATGDNFLTAWHNGEEIITPDPSNSLMWKDAYSVPLTLHPSFHLFAFEVRNAPKATPSGSSPIGLIYDLYELDDSGKIVGSLLHSHPDQVYVHDNTPEPGWYPAQALKKTWLEAQAFGYAGPSLMSLGFTDYHDSAGQAWAGPRGTFPVQIGGPSLLDFIAQLTEAGKMDVTVDTVTMKLQAWNRLGQDRYSTVEIKPANEGGNALSIAPARAHSRFNSVLTRLDDGTLIEVRDQASVDAWGVIGAGLSVSASTEATARSVALAQMAEAAQSRTSLEVQLSSVFGLVPGKHFFLGDSVKARDTRNATIKARVMSINWKLSKPDEVVAVSVELEQDFT
jgi:hypothetical protein